MEQFTALIIDPNAGSRSYLWEAVLADRHFSTVTASKSLEESLAMFSNSYSCDVILISSAFDPPKIKAFVGSIRNTEGGKESALVTVMRAADQTSANLGLFLSEGSDGFVLSPFSVFSVGQVSEIAKKVKKDHDRKRKLAATSLLMVDLVKTVDDLGRCFMRGASTEKPKKSFGGLADKITEIVGEDKEVVTEALLLALKKVEPPKMSGYKGASKRVKSRLDSK